MSFSSEDGFYLEEEATLIIDEAIPDTAEGDNPVEFWPVDHPMEPSDEDSPVKCPMPYSSLINEEDLHEEQFAENWRKTSEVARVVMERTPPEHLPDRQMRKRHHRTLSSRAGHHTMTPFIRMPALLPSLPAQNIDITVFHMLQQSAP